MKLVVFGLTVSSSWGNGHATLWRGLCRALGTLGHRVVFFERDVPYYAEHRDLTELPGHELRLYARWSDVQAEADRELTGADVGMVTSYCPDAAAATRALLQSRASLRAFYDLDTPVTLSRLAAGEQVDYIPPDGLRDFDLVFSYTGGRALDVMQRRLGARRVAPLYGSVDSEVHRPVTPNPSFAANLSYLGTYAQDRQDKLMRLLLAPAAERPDRRFLIGGSQYPARFTWMPNIYYVRHVPPSDHAAFFSSAGLTLNITRKAMASMGWCPAGRLFEAAACGAPIVTDTWDGLDAFFQPGVEVLAAARTEDVLAALDLGDEERRRIGAAGRDRALACHTALNRARDFEAAIAGALAVRAPGHDPKTAPGSVGEPAQPASVGE
jgi:spore maturation protein CgeB